MMFLVGGSAQAQWSVDNSSTIMTASYGQYQYFAFDKASGYVRLITGPDSGWGTSVLVLPSFWEGGRLNQGGSTSLTTSISGTTLTVKFTSQIRRLKFKGEMKIYAPFNNQIVADVKMTRTRGRVNLDNNRPGEAFRPVFLSSMRVSSTQWDTQGAYDGINYSGIPTSGLIFNANNTSSRITLDGGSNSWKTNAPTVDIYFDRELTAMGYVTPSNDPNDDNVGLWLGTQNLIRTFNYRIVSRKY